MTYQKVTLSKQRYNFFHHSLSWQYNQNSNLVVIFQVSKIDRHDLKCTGKTLKMHLNYQQQAYTIIALNIYIW